MSGLNLWPVEVVIGKKEKSVEKKPENKEKRGQKGNLLAVV